MSTQEPMNNPNVKLGFIALIDCAPFVIANEKGFFAQEQISVTLTKEASWASIRDKVAFNLLDGAHMLASMPLAASLGVGTVRTQMQASFTVSHNGNGITVGNRLYGQLAELAESEAEIRNGKALHQLIQRRKETDEPLRFATVYPYSSHNYQLRDWLSRAGIDPDTDLQIIVVPPTRMVDCLQQGEIDGYCVGEPWNSLAVERQQGHMLVTGYELWGSTPEKVLGVNSAWAESNPDVHLAMIRALDRACRWVDEPGNQQELLQILSHPDYLNCPAEELLYGFSSVKPKGAFDWPMEANQRFSGAGINEPLPNYALWILGQMWRWKQLAKPVNMMETVQQVYRQDLYQQALSLTCSDQLADIGNEQAWLQKVASGGVQIHPKGIQYGFQELY